MDVNDRTYTVSGLTPATPYIFRVAGVTSGGTGPFSPFRIVITMDGCKLNCYIADYQNYTVLNFASTAPGPIFNLTVGPKFTAVQISWGAPQMPNGVITQYEVTYRVNGGNLIANTTDLATTFIIIPSLNPGTIVSDITLTAFTSGGRGDASITADFTTPVNPVLRECSTINNYLVTLTMFSPLAVVTNVRVEQLTETSVRVSWDAISLPEVTRYRVFYS